MRAQVNSSHSLLPATSLRLTAPPPDGGVYAATVFDVLFVLLPVLEHHRQKARCRPFQLHTCASLTRESTRPPDGDPRGTVL